MYDVRQPGQRETKGQAFVLGADCVAAMPRMLRIRTQLRPRDRDNGLRPATHQKIVQVIDIVSDMPAKAIKWYAVQAGDAVFRQERPAAIKITGCLFF